MTLQKYWTQSLKEGSISLQKTRRKPLIEGGIHLPPSRVSLRIETEIREQIYPIFRADGRFYLWNVFNLYD